MWVSVQQHSGGPQEQRVEYVSPILMDDHAPPMIGESRRSTLGVVPSSPPLRSQAAVSFLVEEVPSASALPLVSPEASPPPVGLELFVGVCWELAAAVGHVALGGVGRAPRVGVLGPVRARRAEASRGSFGVREQRGPVELVLRDHRRLEALGVAVEGLDDAGDVALHEEEDAALGILGEPVDRLVVAPRPRRVHRDDVGELREVHAVARDGHRDGARARLATCGHGRRTKRGDEWLPRS
mmetsp:Transcript_5887/g.24616  ORF Transcript_5887/g.24616 Transcript_5887/m.24616 type:complete len:240 (+) Transcript_5887:603-1322(+)